MILSIAAIKKNYILLLYYMKINIKNRMRSKYFFTSNRAQCRELNCIDINSINVK